MMDGTVRMNGCAAVATTDFDRGFDQEKLEYDRMVSTLREEEYPMLQGTLDANPKRRTLMRDIGSTYLDHAGTTLYAKSLIESFSKDMLGSLFGNPHSASTSSQLASQRIDNIRLRTLKFFKADPEHFDMVFVANATAGIKLVVDAFSGYDDGFWYGYHRDSHTSLIGAREAAKLGSRCFTSDIEVDSWLDSMPGFAESFPGLFAYPAQSNMNGRRLPLQWCGRLRKVTHGQAYSLLDAAAHVSTTPLDLSDPLNAPDFVTLSFYKVFGFPDLGALIVRKDAGHVFSHRKYFGGGTVETVSCLEEQWHLKKEGVLHTALEDGTLPVHNIIALDSAMKIHEGLFGGLSRVSSHTTFLSRELYGRLGRLRHGNGLRACEIYKDPVPVYGDAKTQGPVVAFNIKDCRGEWVANSEVQKLAVVRNIHLRTGSLCNPGGIAHCLKVDSLDLKRHYAAGFRCGNVDDAQGGKPLGMIRISLGAMSTLGDIDTLVHFISEFFVEKGASPEQLRIQPSPDRTFHVESLTIYPIKSCGGWKIPADVSWTIRPEGLMWDREWCLVHQGTHDALSQKRFPKMALFRPSLDLYNSCLHVRFVGSASSDAPLEITLPLSTPPSLFRSCTTDRGHPDLRCSTNLCGDKIKPLLYASEAITTFFSTHLGIPVYLARLPSATHSNFSLCSRQAKVKLATQTDSAVRQSHAEVMPGSFPTPPPSPPPRPLLLANESPILVISRSSVDRLNESIAASGGEKVNAEVFRANLVIAQQSRARNELGDTRDGSFVEDGWKALRIVPQEYQKAHTLNNVEPFGLSSNRSLVEGGQLDILGPCRRCQMVCIDQDTGNRRQEPFVSLAKTRKWGGGVWFGVHAGLAMGGIEKEVQISVGDSVIGS